MDCKVCLLLWTMSFIHNLQCLSLYFVVMVSVYSQLIMEKQEQYNQKKICKGIFVLMNYSNKKNCEYDSCGAYALVNWRRKLEVQEE